MFETPLTVVGNVVNDPQRRVVGDQEVIRFRVASNSRRRDAEGNWETSTSLFVTVNCWGRLVTGVGAALGKGSPVIVVGYVYTSEYEDREGVRRSSLEMRATSVGPDVSRVIVRTDKPSQSGTAAAPDGGQPAAGAGATETAPDKNGAKTAAKAGEKVSDKAAGRGGDKSGDKPTAPAGMALSA
jgi:single-strand DNA-binding protein